MKALKIIFLLALLGCSKDVLTQQKNSESTIGKILTEAEKKNKVADIAEEEVKVYEREAKIKREEAEIAKKQEKINQQKVKIEKLKKELQI